MVEKVGQDIFSRPFNVKAFEKLHPGLVAKTIKGKKAPEAQPPKPTQTTPAMRRQAIRPGDWKPPAPDEE